VELASWAGGISDFLVRFWADAIMEDALRCAMQYVSRYQEEHFGLQNPSAMHPGSLEDWPLRQQVELFSLFKDPGSTVGVQLTESCLMIPAKSVSGISFAHEASFASCQLCMRPDCPNRRAVYDPDLYQQKYAVVP
jgi:hypothetical protein